LSKSEEEVPEGARTLAGGVGGVLVGWAVGGPVGALIGGLLGLMLGGAADAEEVEKKRSRGRRASY